MNIQLNIVTYALHIQIIIIIIIIIRNLYSAIMPLGGCRGAEIHMRHVFAPSVRLQVVIVTLHFSQRLPNNFCVGLQRLATYTTPRVMRDGSCAYLDGLNCKTAMPAACYPSVQPTSPMLKTTDNYKQNEEHGCSRMYCILLLTLFYCACVSVIRFTPAVL